MQSDTLYIIPRGSFGDKNNNIQFNGSTGTSNFIKNEVLGIAQWAEYPQFKKLNLFIQGDDYVNDTCHWIMIESWSFDDDLFWEFAEWIANKCDLKLEIGFPS